MAKLIYTFRTFPWKEEIENHFGQKPFVFGKLKQSLEEFKELISIKQPELIIGIAKSPNTHSIMESEAINVYNKHKTIIKGGPSSYSLFIPQEIPSDFKIREEGTNSFCNWTEYHISHHLKSSGSSCRLMFVHLATPEDIKSL